MTSLVLLDLRADGRLRLNEGACLPLRSAFGGCRACAQACPVQAITVDIERVRVTEACIGCGRCAAVCPNEALAADGLEELQAALRTPLPQGVRLECSRVPSREDRPGTVRVPCLGGISPGRLAELQAHAGDTPVQLIDRGWCGQCNAGGAAHPAQRAVATVTLWLTNLEGGARQPAVPELRAEPLPMEKAQPFSLPPAPAADPAPISRRQFFRTLAQNPTGMRRRATPMGSDGRAAFPAGTRRASPERTRLLAALDNTARRTGSTVPSEFFPRLTQTGGCVDHRICVAACPTGALAIEDNDGGAALHFSGAACIACGACTRACPEHALQLDAHHGVRQAQVIARHARRACSNCGERFSPRADETLCSTCLKTQRFIGDAMVQLFAAKN